MDQDLGLIWLFSCSEYTATLHICKKIRQQMIHFIFQCMLTMLRASLQLLDVCTYGCLHVCKSSKVHTACHIVAEFGMITLSSGLICQVGSSIGRAIFLESTTPNCQISLPEDWRRPRGRPRITWLSTIQKDIRSHNVTLPEAMEMAQNQSLWRMWSTYGAT